MSPANQIYGDTFYRNQMGGSEMSAEVILPLLIRPLNIKSIVDVGCGVGTWLAVASRLGVQDIQGVEGHWVSGQEKRIPDRYFMYKDLASTFRLNRQFDLVLCLEVAEHLPSQRAATFVSDLTLGNVILFSAAVPGQGGTGHLNEQWLSYWAQLFAGEGYLPIDCVRARIWWNERVEVWYRQNIVLFCRAEIATSVASRLESAPLLDVVHPQLYERAWQRQPGPGEVLEPA
jgi:SAM-dependent methyltransferase